MSRVPLLFALALGAGAASAELLAPERAPRLPEFTQTAPEQWLNSRPLKVDDLKGSVVLLEFWTFDCENCFRSIPWLHSVEKRFGPQGLRVVSIHTPELPQERVRANVVAKLAQFAITNPVMLDADYRYWDSLGNRYWPAFYAVDKHGRLRALFVGEMHEGDTRVAPVEAALAELLAEP